MKEGITFLPKNYKPNPNSGCQKVDMTQFPYRGPTVLQLPLKLTVTFRFPLGAFELTHIFVR